MAPGEWGARPAGASGEPFRPDAGARGALAPPAVFEDRPCYRLTEIAVTGGVPRMTFGPGTYFDIVDLSEAVAHERSGAELAGIVAALRRKGYAVEGQELKRVPAPWPQDHPRGALLRHKRLIYGKRWPVERWIATAKPKEMVAKVWRDGEDLNAWLEEHLGD